MADIAENPLINLSEALAERVRLARPLVAGIAVPGHRMRSGTVWRKDVVVASEQRFPDAGDAQVTLADGSAFTARVAGRDPGTNVVALQFDGALDPAPHAAGQPQPGGLALALAADDSGIAVRLGIINSVGPSWHSRAGGRIDRRITLDVRVTPREEGGPVIEPAGGLLGISTLGPRGRVLVIPASTVEAVLEPAALERTGRTRLARPCASTRPRAGSAAGRSRSVAGSDGDERLEGRPRSASKPARRRHSREDRGRERHEPDGGRAISWAGFGRKRGRAASDPGGQVILDCRNPGRPTIQMSAGAGVPDRLRVAVLATTLGGARPARRARCAVRASARRDGRISRCSLDRRRRRCCSAGFDGRDRRRCRRVRRLARARRRRGSGRCRVARRRSGVVGTCDTSTSSEFRFVARGAAGSVDAARNRGAWRSWQRHDEQGGGAAPRNFAAHRQVPHRIAIPKARRRVTRRSRRQGNAAADCRVLIQRAVPHSGLTGLGFALGAEAGFAVDADVQQQAEAEHDGEHRGAAV